MALALLAAVLVVAARSAPEGPSQRVGRRVELAELIQAEQARAATLAAEVDDLAARVAAAEAAGTPDAALQELRAEVDAALAPAGLTGLEGPGVVVRLTDALGTGASPADYDDLVVHEQDLQAVVNALWAGGAEGMTVAGERVLATTAIRCVGNVLLLHGRTYSPPYVVEAVGEQAVLRGALQDDPAVQRLRAAAAEFGLGYQVEDAAALSLPAPADPPLAVEAAG